MSDDEERMTGAEFLGEGVSYSALSGHRPKLAADFVRAVESVMERFELHGESGMTDPPFVNWSFHHVGRDRWVARMTMYRKTEPLYMEWNKHMNMWSDTRVHSSVQLLGQEPTRPLRVRPRATDPQESSIERETDSAEGN